LLCTLLFGQLLRPLLLSQLLCTLLFRLLLCTLLFGHLLRALLLSQLLRALLLNQLLRPLLFGQLPRPLLRRQPLACHILAAPLFGHSRSLFLFKLFGELLPARQFAGLPLLLGLLRKPALAVLARLRFIALALLVGCALLGQYVSLRLFTFLLPHQFFLDRSALPGQRCAAALCLGACRRLGRAEHGLFVGLAPGLAIAIALGSHALAFFFALARIGLGRELRLRGIHLGGGGLLARHRVRFERRLGGRRRQLEIVVA